MYRKPVKHSFQVFSENLKKEAIGNVLLCYGPEQYLVRWAVETLVHAYVNPAAQAVDYVVLDEDDVSCRQVIEACETLSMFSARRVVWVKNFKPLNSDSARGYRRDELEELIDYLPDSNDRTILVFSAEEIKTGALLPKALQAHGQCYHFDAIDRPALLSFARKRFRTAGVEISDAMLSLLVDTTGYFHRESDYRLYHFVQDIQKVLAHSDGVQVREADILETVSGDLETFVFDMLDSLSKGQKERAFRILYNMLYAGREIRSVIGALASQFEMMLSVKQMREDGLDLDAMQKRLGGSTYRIRKMLPQTGRFTQEKLKQILIAVYEMDRNIKTGRLDGRMALELLIAGV